VPRRRISDKQRYANQFATVSARLESVEPFCRHFERCGGCNLQDLRYADQVAAKRQVFWRLIGKMKARWALRGVLPGLEASPLPTGYRQRMDFVFAFGRAGLRGSGFDDVIELEECHLVDQPGWRCFHQARAWARELAIPDYDPRQRTGQLRYASLRCNRAGEVLLSLITRDRTHDDAVAELARRVLAQGLAVGVHQLLNPGKADRSDGAPHRHWGAAEIEERLGDLRFGIAPTTFFQANPAIAERAYAHIADWLAPLRPALGLDLYSGTATIAAQLARSCRRVIAVEHDPANQAPARANLARNGIANVDYRLQDVAAFLRDFREPVDALVLNPPRGGVGPKALAPIVELAPERIAYMSCNALSFLEDAKRLATGGYRCERLWVLDMFPQTRHFEVLACFARRHADDPPEPHPERGEAPIDFLTDRD